MCEERGEKEAGVFFKYAVAVCGVRCDEGGAREGENEKNVGATPRANFAHRLFAGVLGVLIPD